MKKTLKQMLESPTPANAMQAHGTSRIATYDPVLKKSVFRRHKQGHSGKALISRVNKAIHNAKKRLACLKKHP